MEFWTFIYPSVSEVCAVKYTGRQIQNAKLSNNENINI
jgi:hypothetical protein